MNISPDDEKNELHKLKKTQNYITKEIKESEERLERGFEDYDFDDYDNDFTYDRYRGSYAQDIAGWSDQDIDDAFDGDPDAYWNID